MMYKNKNQTSLGSENVTEHSATENDRSDKSSGSWLKPAIFIAAIMGIFIAAWQLNIGEQISSMRGWIESLGVWGILAYIVIYVVATILALPGSILTLAAGPLFGAVLGTVAVSIASTTGASLAFLVARYIARDSIEKKLAGNEKFKKLDKMVARNGWIIIAVTRLVPLFPFVLLNFSFGLTRVRFWTFVLFSWICMLPGTVMYVAFGDALSDFSETGKIPWPAIAIIGGMIALLAILAPIMKKYAVDPDDEDGVE